MVDIGFIIPPNNYTQREESVIKILKDNENLKIKSFLNVGFHNWEQAGRHWWIRICKENNIDWKILEIFEPNIQNAIDNGCPLNKIIHGDILDIDRYPNVDCLFFWHGPEHIKKNIFIENLKNIEKKVNKLIIFGMPLGYEEQDAAYGNPHEVHVSEWYSEDWKNLGYETIEVYDRKPAHITVYKILKHG